MMLNAEMTPMAVGHPRRLPGVLVRVRQLLPRQRVLTREEQIFRYEVLRAREEEGYRAIMLASRII
jgi:hypothetical protein